MTQREIKLTQGKSVLVDEEDFEWLNKWKWYANKQRNMWYAVRKVTIAKYKQNTILMHREILKPQKGAMTDHINRDGLDNRRDNLRECTNSQNLCNRPRPKGNKSFFKGVSWHKECDKWRSQIMVNYKKINLGNFSTPEEAAIAYDNAALKYHGEFATLNFY